MAARLPQGTSSVAYQIKAAWASKIHVLYWAADADKLHRLLPGDTATTIITRAASGCTFDSSNGVIAGDNATRFTDSIAGGFGGLQENSNFVAGASWLGDVFNSGTGGTIGLSSAAATSTGSSFLVGSVNSYTIDWRLLDGSGNNSPGSPFSDDTVGWMTLAARFDQADATAKIRAWGNGSEFDGKRTNGSTGNTSKLGDTGRPLYIGDSYTGTGNTRMHFEFAFLAAVLSDADMATITSDPSSVIEVASIPTRLATPSSQLSLPRSALAAASSHSFRRFG